MNSRFLYKIVFVSLLFFALIILTHCEEIVSDICLRCLCTALTDCNLVKTCDGVGCGLFYITWGYWADGGKATIEGEASSSHTAYANCVNDPYCAAVTIRNYMKTFGRDCNGDDKIDCYDFAAIHQLGAFGCHNGITGLFGQKINDCLKANGE